MTQRGRDKCDWTGWVGQGETKQELVLMETVPAPCPEVARTTCVPCSFPGLIRNVFQTTNPCPAPDTGQIKGAESAVKTCQSPKLAREPPLAMAHFMRQCQQMTPALHLPTEAASWPWPGEGCRGLGPQAASCGSHSWGESS